MTSQMQADIALLRWQATRYSELTPEQRIEMAFYDFILPPAPCQTEYEATMRRVEEAMQEECFA